MPEDEGLCLVVSCCELLLDNGEKALQYLREAIHLTDGAYPVHFVALKDEKLKEAADYLIKTFEKHDNSVTATIFA